MQGLDELLADRQVSAGQDRKADDVDRLLLRGGDARVNASILTRIFAGEAGPPRTAVVLNSAALIHLAGVESDMKAAAERAAAAIDRGDAARTLARWIAVSKEVAA